MSTECPPLVAQVGPPAAGVAASPPLDVPGVCAPVVEAAPLGGFTSTGAPHATSAPNGIDTPNAAMLPNAIDKPSTINIPDTIDPPTTELVAAITAELSQLSGNANRLNRGTNLESKRGPLSLEGARGTTLANDGFEGALLVGSSQGSDGEEYALELWLQHCQAHPLSATASPAGRIALRRASCECADMRKRLESVKPVEGIYQVSLCKHLVALLLRWCSGVNMHRPQVETISLKPGEVTSAREASLARQTPPVGSARAGDAERGGRGGGVTVEPSEPPARRETAKRRLPGSIVGASAKAASAKAASAKAASAEPASAKAASAKAASAEAASVKPASARAAKAASAKAAKAASARGASEGDPMVIEDDASGVGGESSGGVGGGCSAAVGGECSAAVGESAPTAEPTCESPGEAVESLPSVKRQKVPATGRGGRGGSRDGSRARVGARSGRGKRVVVDSSALPSQPAPPEYKRLLKPVTAEPLRDLCRQVLGIVEPAESAPVEQPIPEALDNRVSASENGVRASENRVIASKNSVSASDTDVSIFDRVPAARVEPPIRAAPPKVSAASLFGVPLSCGGAPLMQSENATRVERPTHTGERKRSAAEEAFDFFGC